MSKILVLAETDGARILPGTASGILFAQQMGKVTGAEGFDLLLVGGEGIGAEAENWVGYGAERVLVVASAALAHPTADRIAAVCVAALERFGATSLVGLASSLGRDVLPRVAALRDLPMLSDVLRIERDAASGRPVFQRPMYAGNIVATVQIEGDAGVFSVRGTAFPAPQAEERQTRQSKSEVVSLPLEGVQLPEGTTWIGLEEGDRRRPELTTASVVVSGGRPLRDAATFERLVGGLADRLGGAVGATRAAVDSGIAPNELQIGQTGKVVAPQLYIAAGISGSVQHLAGMKDSKVIVAINTDPNAPIFEVADYGLVADLHTALPELIARLAPEA